MPPFKTIDPAKTKSFKYLINCIQDRHHVFTDKPKYALLIGAGCSYKSNVPLGSGVIDICQKLSYLKNEISGTASVVKDFLTKGDVKILNSFLDEDIQNNTLATYISDKHTILKNRVLKDRDIEEKKLKEFIDDADWPSYEEKIIEDAQYGFWMDEFDNAPKERQRLIESLIEHKDPGGAYILLAYLIESKVFTNILTTNFDDLINDALAYYTNTKCRFYADDELSQYISIYSDKPNIIKLHGDYRFANMKNTSRETVQLSKNLELKIGELLQNFNVIVVGYNGADHSIMNALNKIKTNSKYELIWCGMNEHDVHWRVAHLINNTDNSYFIKIGGFDEMMGLLYPQCKKGEPQNLEKKAKERQKLADVTIEQFASYFNQSNVSDVSKAAFNKSKYADDLFSQAYQEKEPDNAIKLYNEVIDLSPNNAAAFNNRGILFFNKKDYDKSIDDYDRAIKIDPKYALAYNNRGTSWYDKGNTDAALADYSKSIEMDPTYSLAYSNRGILLAGRGEYEKAIEDYNLGIKYNNKDEIIFRDRGQAWLKLKNYEKALADYEMANRLKPGDPIIVNALANAYRMMGQTDKALGTVQDGLAVYPDDVNMQHTIAEIYAAMGNKDVFYTEVEKAMQLGAPVWLYLDDEVYAPFKEQQQFKDLIAKYKKE